MLNRIRQLARAENGIAAVEFALVAPVLILMFLGSYEVTAAVDCNARTTHLASTTADLVAQSTSVSSTDTSNVFAASNAILFPYPANPKIVVSSVIDTNTDCTGGQVVKVAWSDAQNTTARTVNTTLCIPDGLVVKGSGGSVIMAEVTYTYMPPTMYFFGASGITFKEVFYSKPRRSTTVAHS